MMSKPGKQKILFCDNSLRELINFREDIIKEYAKEGKEVVLLAPENKDYFPPYPNIRLIPINLERTSMNPFRDLQYLIKLYKIYKKEKPDYIFHYTIKPNIYGSFAAKAAGIHSTAMIAGLGYVFTGTGMGSRIARFLYKMAMKIPDKVLVLNENNRDILLSHKIVASDKLILLKGGEGVNLKKFNTDV